MFSELRPGTCDRQKTATLVLVVCLLSTTLRADTARLKNGTVIEGEVVPIQALTIKSKRQAGDYPTYRIRMVDSGTRRVFVPWRQIVEEHKEATLSKFQTFDLPQRKQGGRKMLKTIGSHPAPPPFDEYGRRTVTFSVNKKPLAIVQGITEIGPKYVKVVGLAHAWEFGIATTSIKPEILDAMIRRVTDQQNPDDRLAIARFYRQSLMLPEMQKELESIRDDFPDYRERVEILIRQLRTLQAQRILEELAARRRAGQHRLARLAALKFPREDLGAGPLRAVQEILDDYESALRRRGTLLKRLEELETKLDDPKLREQAAEWRADIETNLKYESLVRLDAFAKLDGDATLSASEKLALAYSGWLLGSANALTDLAAAMRLGYARDLVTKYLTTEDKQQRNAILVQLENLESVTLPRVQQLIELLPPVLETRAIDPGKVLSIDLPPDEQRGPASYSVLLPTEYNPHHKYPLLIALHEAERTTEWELTWWRKQSQRRGYVVIAPEYVQAGQRSYDHRSRGREIVEAALQDARKRFRIDSDRVFLAGHGMGGDAAFDIGMSRPQLFAGVIPITGICDRYARYYWRNAKHVAWYVVGGERDRNALERNSPVLNSMLERADYDVMYVEYIGRGYETYYAEIHNLFDWMDRHTRKKYIREFKSEVLRTADDRFYWVEMQGMPRNVQQAVVLPRGIKVKGVKPPKPMTLSARVSPGNVVHLTSGAKVNTVWLSPEFVDFKKEMEIRVGTRRKFKGFPRPEIGVLLEDLRIRGDREKPYLVKKVLD